MTPKILSATIFISTVLSLAACTKKLQTNRVPAFNSAVVQTNSNAQSNAGTQKPESNEASKMPAKTFSARPSEIIEALHKKRNENPQISAKELAAFGNEIIKTKGYDYTFDWEPKGKENEKAAENSDMETSKPFDFTFDTTDGAKAAVKLYNKTFAHPCYSVIDLPLTKIGIETATILTDKGEIEVNLPKEFYLEEMALVDDAKKPLRRWKTPIDGLPVGISEDGKKIYIDNFAFMQDVANNFKESPLNLAIEIGENGALRFVDYSEIKSDKGVDVSDKTIATEIQYKKYKVGGKEYTLKYSSPCT